MLTRKICWNIQTKTYWQSTALAWSWTEGGGNALNLPFKLLINWIDCRVYRNERDDG